MHVINQEHALVPTAQLLPHPRNVNRGNVEAIQASIEENGFYGAVIAQRRTGFILVGHHRYQAAVQSGAEQVPVIWIDVDDRRALNILLADNRTAELAMRDEEALTRLLQELASDDAGLTGTGYETADLDLLLARTSDELPESFKVLNDSIMGTVKHITCPHCGEAFPA